MFSLLAILFACKTKKGISDQTKSNYNASDVIASIERTACFGFCPVYKMEIYGDGTVHYIGTRNVDRIGVFKGKASIDKIDSLIIKAKEIGFMNLKDEYDGSVSDLPATHTSVMMDGKTKKIKSRYGTPDELRGFNNYFDGLFKDVKLNKVVE